MSACFQCGKPWRAGHRCEPSQPDSPAYEYLAKQISEVRERLERLERRMERVKEVE